MLSDIKQN